MRGNASGEDVEEVGFLQGKKERGMRRTDMGRLRVKSASGESKEETELTSRKKRPGKGRSKDEVRELCRRG